MTSEQNKPYGPDSDDIAGAPYGRLLPCIGYLLTL